MNRTILSTLLCVLFLSLLCGCPRTDEAGGSTSTPADPPPAAVQTETPAENPCTAEENPCNPCAENPCGENPCGENPCAENPCADNPCSPDENPCNPCAAAEDVVTTVVLETTDGDIVLEVHSAWGPIGSAHFLELVRAGYYNGAPWFRVMDGFVAQCGIAADSAMTRKWQSQTIKDEPVIVGNKRGFVSFGTSGPNSRSTHIFINYADNAQPPMQLDRQGFSAFAQVVEGMDIADGLFKCEFDQGILSSPGGVQAFKDRFPDADFINKAYIRE